MPWKMNGNDCQKHSWGIHFRGITRKNVILEWRCITQAPVPLYILPSGKNPGKLTSIWFSDFLATTYRKEGLRKHLVIISPGGVVCSLNLGVRSSGPFLAGNSPPPPQKKQCPFVGANLGANSPELIHAYVCLSFLNSVHTRCIVKTSRFTRGVCKNRGFY